ncbi:MAG: ATP-binding protein [Gammaproteobacteria bacterium]|nr:ATP-binding protein [Gammaproteobacteria bacterium]
MPSPTEILDSDTRDNSPGQSVIHKNLQTESSTSASPFWLSGLRLKWFGFLAALFLYLIFMVADVAMQRETPLHQIEAYQTIQQSEEALVKADLAIFHVVTALFIDLDAQDLNAIVAYFSLLKERYAELEGLFPERAEVFSDLVEFLPFVLENPSPGNLTQLSKRISFSKYELDSLMEINRKRRQALLTEIRDEADRAVIESLILGVFGILLFGVITGLFFRGLLVDIACLRARVLDVVSGFRGSALQTSRQDELGELFHGVNYMTETLARREEELEIERRKSSYTEKMRATERLIGGISHEINNPLTSIEGLARLLRKDLQGLEHQEQAREKIEEILDYSAGLTQVMRELHFLSSPEADRNQLYDFNQLIAHTTGLEQLGRLRQEIDLKLELDSSLPAVYGVEEQMGLVISNILENAIDALSDEDGGSRLNGERPTIVITTGFSGQNLICCIEDNGSGIALDIQDRLFEPFFTTKTKGKKNGLGLAICESIIATYAGTLTVESQPGKGTRININLPFSHEGITSHDQ